MERVIGRSTAANVMLAAVIIGGLFFSMLVISYGMDTVVKGAHDTFHDFRHVIGMPCH